MTYWVEKGLKRPRGLSFNAQRVFWTIIALQAMLFIYLALWHPDVLSNGL